jgi:putative SOS response-associated peptidase YedK
MCGRFTLAKTLEDIEELVGDLESEIPVAPRYNIAPSQPVLTLPQGATPQLTLTQWGLVPRWAKDPSIGARMINARSETVAEKPAFRASLKYQRCLIFADGFFEWQATPGTRTKTPMYIRLKSRSAFAFAGLYAHWQGADGSELTTSTILTTAACPLLSPIHHRMPVILPPEAHARWLDPNRFDPAELAPLLAAFPDEALEVYPVSTRVNHVRNDDPECIRPAPSTPAQGELF